MAVEHRDRHAAVGTGPNAQPTLLIGLLADPGLPTTLAEDLARTLPEMLADQPEPGTRYRFVVITESLRRRGDARGQRLIDLAAERAAQEGWDFALALTDLPVHQDDQPVVAELSQAQTAALLFVTAVNPLKPAEEAREIAAGVILEWAARERSDADTRPLRRLEDRSPSLQPMEPEDDDVDLRVTRSAGALWTLAGMVRVNRPWRLVLALRGALAASVATAAFGLVSSPVWQVSGAISTVRLWIATAVSVITMVGWLILNHGLWQHADPGRTPPDPPLQRGDRADADHRGAGVLSGSAGRERHDRLVHRDPGGVRRLPPSTGRVPGLPAARLARRLPGDHRRSPRVGLGVERHRPQRNLGIPLPPRPSAPAQEARATGRRVDRIEPPTTRMGHHERRRRAHPASTVLSGLAPVEAFCLPAERRTVTIGSYVEF